MLGYKKTNQTNLKGQNLVPYHSHVMPDHSHVMPEKSMHLLKFNLASIEITLSFYNFVYRPYFGINRTFLVLTSPHCMGPLFRDTSLKCVASFISIVYCVCFIISFSHLHKYLFCKRKEKHPTIFIIEFNIQHSLFHV